MTGERKDVEHPIVRDMSAIERSEALMRVAMKSPEKMKEWADASGRTWCVFNTRMLIDSCVWPEGAQAFQLMCANYRDHRAGLSDPLPETLTATELDRAIRYLVAQITELDPTWTLGSDPR